MLNDQQGAVLSAIQFGAVVFYDNGEHPEKVWRDTGLSVEAVFEQETQDTVLQLVSDGLAELPPGFVADCVVKPTRAGVAELDAWRREVRSRR